MSEYSDGLPIEFLSTPKLGEQITYNNNPQVGGTYVQHLEEENRALKLKVDSYRYELEFLRDILKDPGLDYTDMAILLALVLNFPNALDGSTITTLLWKVSKCVGDISDDRLGQHLKRLHESGRIEYNPKRFRLGSYIDDDGKRVTEFRTETQISLTPLFIMGGPCLPTKKLRGGGGNERVLKGREERQHPTECENCGGHNLKPYADECLDCGHVMYPPIEEGE